MTRSQNISKIVDDPAILKILRNTDKTYSVIEQDGKLQLDKENEQTEKTFSANLRPVPSPVGDDEFVKKYGVECALCGRHGECHCFC